ncbi:hypothetical protein GHT06_020209 [Daphnia sinensis]|uniref:FAR1 domain-containing protein n=1 Tax=Daphnia sinensis TaxID=1820382 RepID=A0AAD5KL52_9CRUS|nr:hypothetical protein GHT06_020209 [Daphnia sinensis]
MQCVSSQQKGSKKVDDERWKYYSAKILCSHHGNHRNRSKGLRPNQKVCACNCPYTWYVSLNVRQQKYEVISCNLEHANHPVSEELIATYGEKKHLDPAALEYITDATRDGAIPLKVRKRVYDEFNVVLKPKT